MFDIGQFRDSIVKYTLKDLQLYSESAEELLVFTCANESRGGTYLRQVNGPALGIYQMEPATYNDLWQGYIKMNSKICMMLFSNFEVSFMPTEDRLIYDLRYATAMTRIFYARIKEALPDAKDINGIWSYYKRYYNTMAGKANKADSIKNYYDFMRR